MSSVEADTEKSVNTRTVQLVKLLTEVGPDIPEIARRLGQFKESVRYRYKEKVLNKGFAIQASIDHERIGLQRLILVIDFAEEYRMYAQSILASMNELCFLVSFAKTMPNGYYVASLSIPKEFFNDVVRFFGELYEKKMFTKLEIHDFDWVRVVPMKAEYYDFDSGRWDFDWTNQPPEEFESAKYVPSNTVKFDYTDLLILKELQMDANKSLKDISDKLDINYKKLAWHYASHVLEKGLIHGYSVNWMGTRYDYSAEKVLHRQHRYFAVHLFVKNLNPYELMSLRQATNRLPYLWSEAVGNSYFCEFAFPVDFVVEGLQYLTDAITPVKDRTDIFAIDQTQSARFTISYAKFDEDSKRWTLDVADLARRYEDLIIKIKGGTG
jgi:hypothetical protein